MFDWVIYRKNIENIEKYCNIHSEAKVEQFIATVTCKSTKMVKLDLLCM